MSWQSTPYEAPLILAALICALIAAYAWRHRPAPGTQPLAVFLVAATLWSLGYALELASAALPAKIFWENVAYIGVQILPLAWLAFALEYSGRERRLTPRQMALLAAEPLLVLAILFLGDPWRLMRSSVHLGSVGAYTALMASHGPLFWVNVAYSYGVVLFGAAQLWGLLEGLFHPNAFYRGQAAMLLIAILAPWIANFLSITGRTPFPGLDLTPFAFTLAGAALGWSVLHYRLLDVIPIARDAVIESMGDAVLVLDARGRVVDLNPAARALLDRPSSAIMGQPISALLPEDEGAIWRMPSA
jgi:PAS domain-containing protein